MPLSVKKIPCVFAVAAAAISVPLPACAQQTSPSAPASSVSAVTSPAQPPLHLNLDPDAARTAMGPFRDSRERYAPVVEYTSGYTPSTASLSGTLLATEGRLLHIGASLVPGVSNFAESRNIHVGERGLSWSPKESTDGALRPVVSIDGRFRINLVRHAR